MTEEKIRARLTEVDINAGGFATITACARDDERVQFRTIVHHTRVPAFRDGLVFTIRNGCVAGEPEPDTEP